MNPYNEAKNQVHDRDLYLYKFPHSWSKAKRRNTRNIRARLKQNTARLIREEEGGSDNG